MKHLLTIFILLTLFVASCQTSAENIEVKSDKNIDQTPEIQSEISPTPKSNNQDINSKIGNVEIGNKCVRLFIENAKLQVGENVQIVLPEGSSQKVSEAEIIKFSECKDEPFGNLEPDNPKAKLTEYLLKLSNKNDINRGFGIGIVNINKKVKIVNGLAIIDLNGDEKSEYFRECTSYEGLHLTVWTGKPIVGKRIWHTYYDFSYATEPTCEDRDFEDQLDIIQSKIGIVDGDKDDVCLRTKNGNLTENTPVSIVTSLYESPQKVLNSKVVKKLEKSCARRASESTDKNPGENFYYSLTLIEKEIDEYQEVFGIGVIAPEKPVRIQDNLASIDLNNDGKAEFFRHCAGFEGTLFAIWTGKPLKGRQIWHSFYYVDYDTEPNCKKKDSEGIED
jgi:hypothetical protein